MSTQAGWILPATLACLAVFSGLAVTLTLATSRVANIERLVTVDHEARAELSRRIAIGSIEVNSGCSPIELKIRGLPWTRITCAEKPLSLRTSSGNLISLAAIDWDFFESKKIPCPGRPARSLKRIFTAPESATDCHVTSGTYESLIVGENLVSTEEITMANPENGLSVLVSPGSTKIASLNAGSDLLVLSGGQLEIGRLSAKDGARSITLISATAAVSVASSSGALSILAAAPAMVSVPKSNFSGNHPLPPTTTKVVTVTTFPLS